jgi:replicative DNA helicase
MGESALAINIAVNAALSHREAHDAQDDPCAKVALFSLDISAEQLTSRILAQRAELPWHKVLRGELNHDEFKRLTLAAQEHLGLKLYIDDTTALSIQEIRHRAQRLKRKEGLDILVVDHLQMLCDLASTRENREQEINRIALGLKALAKELNIPVVLSSSLTRNLEERIDKRPRLTDLPGDGAIQQVADVIMLLHRESYYLEREEPVQLSDETIEQFHQRHSEWVRRFEDVKNTSEIIVAQHRHGLTGIVQLAYWDEYLKFGNLSD